MHCIRSFCALATASLVLVGSTVAAAASAELFPADSGVAKANPAWQRLLLNTLEPGAKIKPGGQQMEHLRVEPATGVQAKFGPMATRFTAQAKGPESRGDYTVAEWVGGQTKMLGMWVNLAADANVAKVGLQLTDKEGENFVYLVDANWTGWKWLEADLAGSQFTPLPDQKSKNGKIDDPLSSVHVIWFAKGQGASAIVVDELATVVDLGEKPAAVPVAVSAARDVTLETNEKLRTQVVLTNTSDKPAVVEMEYLVQQDPQLFDKLPPEPLYGVDIATGKKSWIESDGRVHQNNSMTDGKTWTEFGTAWHNDNSKNTEAFGYVDLGSAVRITHLGFSASDAGWMWKFDFASSLDGKEYAPIEGLQGMNFRQKWGPQEINVPKPFEARFLRIRQHNDGKGVTAFRFFTELHVYSAATEGIWAFPKTGSVLQQGKLTHTVPAKSYDVVEFGDGRALVPGAYLLAVRTKAAGLTQLTYQHLLVMPPAMAKVTRDSRFGLNGIGLHKLSHRQGNGWNRFENLKWPFVSPSPGVYRFDGSVHPNVKFDELFRADRENGIFILPYLSMTPSYLVPAGVTKGGTSYPPTDFSKFGEFAFQAVARYGSKKHPPEVLLTNDKLSGLGYVDVFELWNEADLNDPNWGAWRGVFTDFYKMYRYGAEGVKKADPDAKVANGGWSGMDVPLMETMRNYKYPDGKCPLDFTDVLSVHYYSFRTAPELAKMNNNTHRDGAGPRERTFEGELSALVAWRDKVKPAMPIWLTETGYDSGGPRGTNERYQACWLPRDVMMILAAGVDKVQVFREKSSGGWGLFDSSGVVRADGSLTPSWFTYATLIRQLDGVTERALKVPLADSNVRVYVWKRGDKPIVTAWAIEGTAKLDVPLGRCTVTDAFGAAAALDVGQGLELTEFPLYISEFADPAAVKRLEAEAKKTAAK